MRRDRFQLIQGLTRRTPETTHALHSPTPQCTPLKHSPPPYSSNDLTLALQASEQRLSALIEDRDRIGRDLHDCVLQSLYVIGLNLETSQRMSPHQSPESRSSHNRALGQINQLIHEVRRMIRSLEGGMAQEFDLALELSTLKTTYEEIGHLQIGLDLQPQAIEVLTKEEEREILNIVREALSNCVRHADATEATISIRMRGTRIRMSVSDDGIGFATTDGRPRGYGLANMEARAKKLGGTFRVQSKAGRGTHIVAEFSLEPILAPV